MSQNFDNKVQYISETSLILTVLPKNESSVIIYSPGKPFISIVWNKYYGSQWLPVTVMVTNIIQNTFLCVQQNIEIHTGLDRG